MEEEKTILRPITRGVIIDKWGNVEALTIAEDKDGPCENCFVCSLPSGIVDLPNYICKYNKGLICKEEGMFVKCSGSC